MKLSVAIAVLLLLASAAHAASPVDHWLWLVAEDRTVWLSQNGGVKWDMNYADLPAQWNLADLAALPGPAPEALLATDQGVWRFAAGKWSPCTTGQAAPVKQLLVLCAPGPRPELRAIYALGEKTVWRSADRGATWASSPLPPGGASRITGGCDGSREVLYAQVGTQIWVRPDQGQEWVRRDAGLPATGDRLVAALPNHPTWAYCLIGCDVWRTDCGGLAWRQIHAEETPFEFTLMDAQAVGPPPGRVYWTSEDNDPKFPEKMSRIDASGESRWLLNAGVFAACPFHAGGVFALGTIRQGDDFVDGLLRRNAADDGWITLAPVPARYGKLAVACRLR